MAIGRRVFWLVVGLGVLAGLGGAMFWWGEPKFEGRPLSSLLHIAYQNAPLETGNAAVARPVPGEDRHWAQAERALQSLGARAVPVLLRMARVQPPTSGLGKLGEKIVQTLRRDPMRAALSRVENHQLAIWGMRRLGPQARPAIPQLTRLLDDTDPEVQWTALQCLAALGPEAEEAVPTLVRRLSVSQRTSAGVRANKQAAQELVNSTAWALGEIGPAARLAVPLLEQMTNEVATVAVIKIRRGSFQPLFERLRDTSNVAEWTDTLMQVVSLGSNAEPAIPLLVAALENTNGDIRADSVWALGALHHRPDLCLGPLVALLNTNTGARAGVLHAVSYFGPAAKPVAPAIARCLSDPEPAIRARAARALRCMNPEAPAK